MLWSVPGTDYLRAWRDRIDGGAAATPTERRNIHMLTLDTALMGFIQAGIGSFLAVFLVRQGASNEMVGLAAALPSLGAVLLSLPASRWVAAWPDPVRVVVVSRAVLRSAYLAIALVPSLGLGSLATLAVVAFWGLHSLPAAVTGLAWTMVVAEIIPAARRPLINGFRWALVSIVTAGAGAAFGFMLDLIPFPLNYQIVFTLSFVAGMVTLWTFHRIRMPTGGGTPQPTRASLGLLSLIQTLRTQPAFARFVLAGFVYRLGLHLPTAVFAIFWVNELHASDTLIGLRTTAGHGMLVLSYLMWGAIAVRRGHRPVLLVASAGLSLYPILTALSPDAVWLVPVALVWGFFASGIDVAFFEALLRTTPPDKRALLVAIDSTLANVAVFIAPLLGTWLASSTNSREALFLAGGLSLAGTALMQVLAVAAAEPARQPATSA